MKSIGIITYHHYCNYGTMLQAYALQHKISSMGYDAELIDFMQDNSMSKLELLELRMKRLPVYIMQRKKYAALAAARKKNAEKAKLFEEFYRKNLVVGDTLYTSSQQLVDNPPVYDGYVVGSDQTWNPYACDGPEAYLLTFVKDDQKKGSYAPSISVMSLTDEQTQKLKKHLTGMQFLSCREFQGAELLKSILGRDVACVIDPTLLLTAAEWEKVSVPVEIKKPYILTYFLGDVEEQRIFVNKLAEKTGFDVISIPISYLELCNSNWAQQWCGPDQFLSLIKNAACVCTDSFHGTAFSINFNTPFFSFCKTKDNEKSSENSRLYSVLEMFGLSDRLVMGTDTPMNVDVDFSSANAVLSQKREEASAYLNRMLETITR